MNRTVKLKPLPRPGSLYCINAAFCDDSNTCLILRWPQNSRYLVLKGLGWSWGDGKNWRFNSHPSTNCSKIHSINDTSYYNQAKVYCIKCVKLIKASREGLLLHFDVKMLPIKKTLWLESETSDIIHLIYLYYNIILVLSKSRWMNGVLFNLIWKIKIENFYDPIDIMWSL